MGQRKRILFFAEAVTLAHITRPLVLAQSLDAKQYDVHFACAGGFDFVFAEDFNITRWPINSIPSKKFIKALATGSRFYNKKTLSNYVNEDIKLLQQLKPDVVVGDFRLSLAVSAPLCSVPYIALTNAHWSPYSEESYPLPDHPLTKFFGFKLTNFFFQLIRPIVFKYHALPHNQLRVDHQLKPLGDLRHVYTHGDYTLYLEVPELISTQHLPENHQFIGPVLWSPDIVMPGWFKALNKKKKNIYVTLGSSGAADKLPEIIAALEKLDANVLVATAGRSKLPSEGNVYVADYLPGIDVIRECDLVICNGGSATAYQALAEGVPVLGIASNMDQYLTMSYLVKAGVGRLIRSECVGDKQLLTDTAIALLESDKVQKAIRAMKDSFHRLSAFQQFKRIIDSL